MLPLDVFKLSLLLSASDKYAMDSIRYINPLSQLLLLPLHKRIGVKVASLERGDSLLE